MRVRALSVNFGWSLCGYFLKLPFSSDQMRVSKKKEIFGAVYWNRTTIPAPLFLSHMPYVPVVYALSPMPTGNAVTLPSLTVSAGVAISLKFDEGRWYSFVHSRTLLMVPNLRSSYPVMFPAAAGFHSKISMKELLHHDAVSSSFITLL